MDDDKLRDYSEDVDRRRADALGRELQERRHAAAALLGT